LEDDRVNYRWRRGARLTTRRYRSEQGFEALQRSKGAIERPGLHPLEAANLLKSLTTANFDETVEVHIKLGVNPRHADQQVRGTVMLRTAPVRRCG